MSATTRTRTRVTGQNFSGERYLGGTTWEPYSGSAQFLLTETVKQGARANEFYGDQRLDMGSAVSIKRSGILYSSRPVYAKTSSYRGTTVIGGGAPGVIHDPGDSGMASAFNSGRVAFQTKAIRETIPTAPSVDVGNIVTELVTDGLPRLVGGALKESWGSIRAMIRAGGEEHLNIQFGLLPLIKDVKDLIKTALHATEIVEQYVRDGRDGREVRRRFVDHIEPQQWIAANNAASFNPGIASIQARHYMEENLRVRRWFVGRFAYYVPVPETQLERLRYSASIGRKLFGTVTAGTAAGSWYGEVWDAIPFSWLVDWFTNLGDIAHNAAELGVDGCVMRYGYAMTHIRYTRERVMVSTSPILNGHHHTEVFIREWKIREGAHPYGFGLTDDMLSAKRLSILVALGLTKDRKPAQSA